MRFWSRDFREPHSTAKIHSAMFMHLSPKERFGYVALGAIILTGAGFVAAQKLRRPAAIELHETQQPPVSFDHGTSKPAERTSGHRETGTSSQLIIDVAGAVNRPGVIAIPAGSRVYDAIREAGGPTEDANIDQVNLAAKAVDGSQIYVPRRGFGGSGAPSTPTGSIRSDLRKQPTSVVDINSADATQFSTLPGVGKTLAQRIVDYRAEHGTFRGVDDLLAVQGFGKHRLDQVRQWLTAD